MGCCEKTAKNRNDDNCWWMDYDMKLELIVDGYMRDIEHSIKSIIPEEIKTICKHYSNQMVLLSRSSNVIQDENQCILNKFKETQLFEISVLGHKNAGKTCLVIWYILNQFIDDFEGELMEENYRKLVQIDGESAYLEILDAHIPWDEERKFEALLRNNWIIFTNMFVLVYDVTCKYSFEYIKDCFRSLIQLKHRNTITIILVANKQDVPMSELEYQVDNKMGEQLALQWDCPFITTSAKTGDQVASAFETLVREHRQYLRNTLKEQYPGYSHPRRQVQPCIIV